MSLNWDTTKCPQGPLTPDTPQVEYAWLESMIWSTIMIDVSSIDQDEMLWRLTFLHKLGYVTQVPPMSMLQRWHGTTVNVAPKTRQQFVTRWMKTFRQDIDKAVSAEIRNSVEA